MSGRRTPMFDPRDVKNATLQVTIVAGTTQAFPAPATAIATRHRYLLGFGIGNISSGSVRSFILEDNNGNDITSLAPFLYDKVMCFAQPLLVGSPGQNGLQVRNAFGADCAVAAWVLFADVTAPIAPAFAVTI